MANGCKYGRTIYVVDKGRLAHGILVLGGRVANVVPDLGTTESGGVVIDLIRLIQDEQRKRAR